MTLLKPTFKINRLVVKRRGQAVVDLQFHSGLNVLRGENSAGKTTIVRLIAFTLGAENIHFNQTALLCDESFLEISANGAILTLRRAITSTVQQPISFYWGAIAEALVVEKESNWQQFPFRRSESKESFSQVLFRTLEMPELRGDSGANITMHQLLRLIYSDQETPSGELFRSEKFDPAITRAAVGDYLLGIDANELYELRLRENTLEKQLAEIKSGIRTIYTAFGSSGTDISLDFLQDRINNLSLELRGLHEKLDNGSYEKMDSPTAASEDNRLREKLSEVHQQLSSFKRRRQELESEIADSALFLSELEERIASLDESMAAEAHLGVAIFTFCPACFSKVDTQNSSADSCALCKSSVMTDSAKSQLARMRNELALQIKESKTIRESQEQELEKIIRDVPALELRVVELEREFKRNGQNWRPARQIAMESISREIGRTEQEIKHTGELMRLAELLNSHNEKAAKIDTELTWVRGRMGAVEREQLDRRQKAYLAVAESLKGLLKNDLERQSEFTLAESIDIDFAANRIAIDGHQQFSASSMVYLRHSFHLALLFASTQSPIFRFPRFVILDGIEDGGMETDRSYNFQRHIMMESDSIQVDHQILLTTSQICPELDDEKYVVGSALSHNSKSIQI